MFNELSWLSARPQQAAISGHLTEQAGEGLHLPTIAVWDEDYGRGTKLSELITLPQGVDPDKLHRPRVRGCIGFHVPLLPSVDGWLGLPSEGARRNEVVIG